MIRWLRRLWRRHDPEALKREVAERMRREARVRAELDRLLEIREARRSGA